MPSKESRLKATLETLDQHIRVGQGDEARRELTKLGQKKVPRPDMALFAQLAWRTNLPLLGARVLNPIVRPNKKIPAAPTLDEEAEYAQCLTRIGAEREALEILKGLSPSGYPRVSLYTAIAHFVRWEYAQALAPLRQYLASQNISSYDRLVGRVNLSAALVYERMGDEAKQLLGELIKEMTKEKFPLLRGNCLELAAQNAIFSKDWNEADTRLKEAMSLITDFGSVDSLFIRKWSAILKFLREGDHTSTRKAIRDVHAEALMRRHWETVRDCDRFLAVSAKDERLLFHVYFGTPLEGFRQRLLSDFGKAELPEEYLWKIRSGTRPTTLDLRTGRVNDAEWDAKVGRKPHTLLLILASDFYKPFRIASLHASLFPGDFFNPITSPDRVHHTIKSLKRWLEEKQVPLTVGQAGKYYRLVATAPCEIRVSGAIAESDRHSILIDRLKEKWAKGSRFSLAEVSILLGLAPRTALRILRKEMEEGRILRSGDRAHTRYTFVV